MVTHRRLRPRWGFVPVLVGLAAAIVVGCGSDPSTTTRFSGPAGAGERLAQSAGCAGCHGATFQGTGTAPKLTGLFGSTVTLEDGSTVPADEAYLRRAITDPQSQRVRGYPVQMPKNQLSDAEVNDLVAFLTALR